MSRGVSTGARRFGTVGGVFIPCTLTILGVILFLRVGYVVGAAGMLCCIVIMALSNLVTTCTTLSLSAIATNTRVQGGGAYFLISRSLGPEFGGAIGVVLYLAQAIAVALHLIGFTEAFTANLAPRYPFLAGPMGMRMVAMAACFLLFLAAYFSASWALKVQYAILACLVLSLVSFIVGAALKFDPGLFRANLWAPSPDSIREAFPAAQPSVSFWVLFALYFPAATGIMAGANMSGDLINPSRSLPRGTLAAIGATAATYLVFALLSAGTVDRKTLLTDSMVMKRLALSGALIDVGIYAATLSSALGCLIGGPRILQAFARDRIIHTLSFFGKGDPVKDEPRRAAVLTLFLALCGILVGSLDLIAPVATMFFMITYGLVNFATFYETYSDSPSFRPQFRFFHWATALAGAAACLVIMFLISAPAAVVSLIVLGAVYWYIARRSVRVRWGDARHGFLFSRARENLLRMLRVPAHPRNWRPTVLVLSGNPKTRPHLVDFADAIGCRKGLVILSQVIVGDAEQMLRRKGAQESMVGRFIVSHKLEAFYQAVIAPDYDSGVNALAQASGIGGFRPNTVLLGWSDRPEMFESYGATLRRLHYFGKNLIVLKCAKDEESPRDRTIDIWWRGQENGPMMLLFAYLLRLDDEYSDCAIRVMRIVGTEAGVEEAARHMREVVEAARIEAEVRVFVQSGGIADMIHSTSKNSTIVLLGLEVPGKGCEREILQRMDNLLKGLPTTALVRAAQQIDLQA
ncbi:MAG: amino acid permease [Planctomycetota bacterium]